MEFKKERNFIVAYDGDATLAKWDIISGQFYGKTNKPVKNCPQAFSYNNLPSEAFWKVESCFLGCAIRFYREYILGRYYNYTQEIGKRFEELLSLGLFPANYRDLLGKTRLTKEIAELFKTNHTRYREREVQEYLIRKENEAFLNDHPQWFKKVFIEGVKTLPKDYVKAFLLRAEKEHVMYFWGDNLHFYTNCLLDYMKFYYDMCMTMYGEVKVTPNLLSNYAQIKALYVTFSEEHYDEILARNNDNNHLYYKNENFEARPLLTHEAFHKEAENQHNCVEQTYMEQVYNGRTYIVTVRRISEPEKSYITCEVNKKGEIEQFLGFANGKVNDKDALKFYGEYNRHLQSAFNG